MRVAPADFCGVQNGFGLVADVLLYNLREPVGAHPAGSTVSAQTLLRHGWAVPLATKSADTERGAWTGLAPRSQAAQAAEVSA